MVVKVVEHHRASFPLRAGRCALQDSEAHSRINTIPASLVIESSIHPEFELQFVEGRGSKLLEMDRESVACGKRPEIMS